MNEPSQKRNQTLRMLKNRPAHIKLTDIAKKTGLHVGWLSMFNQGKIIDPSHTRLETLYQYLVQIKIKV